MSRQIKVSMVATTGIAATLLVDGTTAHRKFLLPIDLEEGKLSNVSKTRFIVLTTMFLLIKSYFQLSMETKLAQDLRETVVFIIDEATMANKYAYQAIDHLLRNVQTSETLRRQPFGGRIILLGKSVIV